MKKIVVVNDDGVHSPGLWVLYEAVRGLGEVFIVTPLEPRSAIGLGLTLHKPIRVEEIVINGVKVYGINGTPSDAIHIARDVVVGNFDLLVSGVNIGANISMQEILASGTLGAAFEAAFTGIPAIAFSADVSDPKYFLNRNYRKLLINSIKSITKYLVDHGFPENVDVINVNFPKEFRGIIRITRPARIRWKQCLEKRIDPRGKSYYWLYGEYIEPEPDTDAYVVLVEKGISITPLCLDLSVRSLDTYKGLERLARYLERSIGRYNQ